MRLTINLTVLLILSGSVAKCARILGIFPSPGYSQFILGEKLMTELAKRGHAVTVISAYSPGTEIQNYETILIQMPDFQSLSDSLFEWDTVSLFTEQINFLDMVNKLTETMLAQANVQALINSNRIFDLVIIENFGNEAQMGFAEHFKAPLVIFTSQGLHEWNSHLVGNVRLPSITPLCFTATTNHMNFIQRLQNTLLSLFDRVYKELRYFPKQQALLDKYFPTKMDLKKVMTSGEMLLLFSNPLTTEPSLLTSSVKEIGGFHIESKKLPTDIQTFLDGAKNGAILISLGSNLDCRGMTVNKIRMFVNVIKRLPQRVLWKCDIDELSNKLDNLFTSKWLPQPDILAHPNTVAFVTHSGLLSTTEAVYHGVPMVCLPIFGDQNLNAARTVQNNIGVKLKYSTTNESEFYEAIIRVTKDVKYRQIMEKMSKMFKDQPVKPLDLAMHSIEYVLKYKPGLMLRSPALDLWWFQLYSLDVFLVIALFITFFYYIFSIIIHKCFQNTVQDKKKKIA